MPLIPLKHLAKSGKYNVRKTHPDLHVGELVASIAAHGLLENLLVVRVDDRYEVIAGGRRLAALQQLRADGRLPDDHAVPCEIVPPDRAEEFSLAENTVREAMHPADQFDAWSRLVEQGQSTGDIAARFGIREELVHQRLKLGRVSPGVIQAFRDDELSLDVLMAYTLTDDHAKQQTVYERFRQSWEANNAGAVRRALTENMVRSDDRRVALVGLDAYQEAGGRIQQDLFKKDCYLEDVELLEQLVHERLEEEAEKLRDTWSWVEVRQSFPYDERAKYRRIYPHSLGEPPFDLREQFDELSVQLDQLADEDDSNDEFISLRQEFDALQIRLNAFNGFTAEERALAGCVVTLGYQGIDIYEGLLRPGQKIPSRNEEQGDDAPATKPRYSERLCERLQSYRLHAARRSLASNFDASFDAVVYALSCRQFGTSSCTWLGASVNEYYYPVTLYNDATLSAMKAEERELFDSLPLAWLNEDDPSRRFTAFCRLALSDKQQLLAACVAVSLRPQLSNSPTGHSEFEAIAERLAVDVVSHWRPTAENFLSRVPKSELLAIGTQFWGESWAHTHRQTKKAGLVAILHHAFDSPSSHSASEAELITSWLPEGMALTVAQT